MIKKELIGLSILYMFIDVVLHAICRISRKKDMMIYINVIDD